MKALSVQIFTVISLIGFIVLSALGSKTAYEFLLLGILFAVTQIAVSLQKRHHV